MRGRKIARGTAGATIGPMRGNFPMETMVLKNIHVRTKISLRTGNVTFRWYQQKLTEYYFDERGAFPALFEMFLYFVDPIMRHVGSSVVSTVPQQRRAPSNQHAVIQSSYLDDNASVYAIYNITIAVSH